MCLIDVVFMRETARLSNMAGVKVVRPNSDVCRIANEEFF